MEPNNNFTTVAAQGGESLSVVGDTYRIVIPGDQTGNAFAVIDMLIPPNGGPGPHSHPAFQESFYVIEGEVEVKTKSETYTATKDSYVRIPLGGVVHEFKNHTDKVAHLLCVVVPSGLEKFFEVTGKPVQPGTFLPQSPPTSEEQQKMKQAGEKYGQTQFPPDYLGDK